MIIHTIFLIFAFLILLPVAIFGVQILIALLPERGKVSLAQNGDKVAVLIPAHNEENGIGQTLNSIKTNAKENTRIVVIADNCEDATAAVARDHGVEVIERFNEQLRGKGYALDFGLKFLSETPPDIVIVFDADCIVYKNTIPALVHSVRKFDRAVQALYLIKAKPGAPVKTRIAEFAYIVKSWTRALGFYRLGLPMQLMGSGMAFPWQHVAHINLAKGYIVEDMKLGIDLANLKLAPKFCPQAYVTSEFPLNEEGAQSQRTRWEHGHLSMIVDEGIPLLFKGVKSFNVEMIAMALDLCVPPLALLFLLSGFLFVLSLIALILTNAAWPWIGVITFIFFITCVCLAWFKHGKQVLPFHLLISYAPIYALNKIKLYSSFFTKKQVDWVKSKRD